MANSTWKITNATTKKDLVVINASVDSDSPRAFYYDQKTALLPFNSAKVLKPGNSDTITIPPVNKDSSGYDLPFTFIVAEAETLAPVKSVTCKADLSDLRELTVDDSTVSDMAQVFDFHKNITAVPGSVLAIGFAALDLTDEKAVSNFFNGTDNYKKVTLDALHLVQSYYNALPYGWTNGRDIVIYLYSEKDVNEDDDGTMKSIGTINITNDWSQPLSLTPVAPFQLELKLNGEAIRPLYFSKGVFRDSQDAAKAKVCLAGSFFIPSLLLDDEGNNEMATYLVGTINGISAFGYEGAQPDGVDDDGNFWKLLSVHNFRDAFTLGVYGVGIIAAIALLVKVGQFLKWCLDRGNPAVDPKKRAAQAEKLGEDNNAEVRNNLQQANEEIVVPQRENIQPAQNNYAAEQIWTKTNQGYRNILRMATNQEKVLLSIGSKLSNKTLQEIADCVEVVRERCVGFESEDPQRAKKFREQMSDNVKLLADNAVRIEAAKANVVSRLTRVELGSYQRAMDIYYEISRAQQKLSEELKDLEEGRNEREIIEDPIIED